MKIFFWTMWCSLLGIEFFLLRALLSMLFHPYNPINMSTVRWASLFLSIGAALLVGSYYFQHIQKMKWACGIAGLPLISIFLYFFIFLILPYLMGERMN